MTIPINNFQDILDAMERDPALRDAVRRHILTDELLQVPARLERIDGDIVALKEGQARMEEDIVALKEGQARMEEDIVALKEGQARMEEDIVALKEGQARMEGDIVALKEGQEQLNDKFNRLDQKVDRIGGDVSRLTGADYESHVAAYIHRVLRRNLGINATVFSSQRDKSDLTKLLDIAESQGLIGAADTDELERTDLVLTADGPTDYLLAEVSVTVQQDDVDRAAERAKLLAQATARTVTPFAIGAREDPDLSRGDVQVVLIPERQTS